MKQISNLIFFLQVSEKSGSSLHLLYKECIALCFLIWFASTKAQTDAFHRNHEPLKMCVCLRTSEAEKSINQLFKEYRNDRFMLVKQGWSPTLTNIQNKPYIFVSNCTFMLYLSRPVPYFTFVGPWWQPHSQLATNFFLHFDSWHLFLHKVLRLDPSSAYWLH